MTTRNAITKRDFFSNLSRREGHTLAALRVVIVAWKKVIKRVKVEKDEKTNEKRTSPPRVC